MFRARLLIAALILTLPALSFAQDAKSVIDAASKAIGVDGETTIVWFCICSPRTGC